MNSKRPCLPTAVKSDPSSPIVPLKSYKAAHPAEVGKSLYALVLQQPPPDFPHNSKSETWFANRPRSSIEVPLDNPEGDNN